MTMLNDLALDLKNQTLSVIGPILVSKSIRSLNYMNNFSLKLLGAKSSLAKTLSAIPEVTELELSLNHNGMEDDDLDIVTESFRRMRKLNNIKLCIHPFNFLF
eukprot:TRINITY_DN3197_c0_g4_i1.p1 TRINITY_DN3197_c0_g4~~TRINITY_DN3197_c0_g4_i1.p1  ORF type:complete len:103 (+),score=12.81 TRINITY_DN3197_c0_g4_i1:268-576(+)